MCELKSERNFASEPPFNPHNGIDPGCLKIIGDCDEHGSIQFSPLLEYEVKELYPKTCFLAFFFQTV